MKKTIISILLSSVFGLLTAFFVTAQTSGSATENKNSPFIQSVKQITFVGPRSGEGYFSADGKKMIFQSERFEGNPFYQIYLLDLKSGKTELMSTGKGQTTCAWIHPTNKKVMFSSSHLDKNFDSKVKAEYAQRQQPGQKYAWSFENEYEIFEKDLSTGKLKNLSNAQGYDAEGSYSPDGKWIAFASNRKAFDGSMSPEDKAIFEKDNSYMMDIFIMKADGTSVKQLTTHKGYDGGPFFSADGKKIVWRRFKADGSSAEIFSMNVDGTAEKQLTRLNAMSWAPFFHPSGKYVVFTTNLHGYQNFELYIVDVEGLHEPVRVTYEEGFDGLPVFSPDGNQISWTKRNAKGDSQIQIASWDHVAALKALNLYVPDIEVKKLSQDIKASDAKQVISYLASAKMLGRTPGSEEEKIYSQKISDLFKSFGLNAGPGQSDYRNKFEFLADAKVSENNWFKINGETKILGKDWTPVSFSSSSEIESGSVVFAGYGLLAPATEKFQEYNSYKGLDVKDKWVMIFRDIPQDIQGENRFHLNIYSRVQHKVTVAKNMGAKGVLLVSGPKSSYKQKLPAFKYDGSLSDSSLIVVNISDEIAQKILDKSNLKLETLQTNLDSGVFQPGQELKEVQIASKIEILPIRKEGINVVAELKVPGAKETILIGAHGDHLGNKISGSSLATADMKDLIHYGADDNASGVSAILELAHYFSKNKAGLKHNIIFAVWSAEELGNLGSKNYLKFIEQKTKTEGLKFPVVGYINLDMIGRLNKHLYVQGLGSSAGWKSILEATALNTELSLIPQEDPYLPTDAISFYVDGHMPVISLFTGSHIDYHTPRDTEEKINYDGVVKIINFTADLVKAVPAKQELLAYKQVQGNPGAQMAGRQFRVYLGTIPDYSQEGIKGVRISGTSQKSPAEKAGLMGKDVIVELAGQKIENLYDFTYALQVVKPGNETVIKVQREGKVVELKIVPALKE